MIQEWFEYVRTEAPSWARERGLVYESVALRARLRRQISHWRPHLHFCQQEIHKFLNQFPDSQRVIVLGSGYLMEFPKTELHSKLRSFFLVDAVHPRETQKYVRNLPQVRLLNIDLATAAENVYRSLEEVLDPGAIVISCNVLSQLPLSVMSGKNEAADRKMTVQILQSHFELLQRLRVPTLLISDYERRFRDSKGSILQRERTLAGLELGRPERHWTWNWAPHRELSMDYGAELEVGIWKCNVSA